MLARREVALSRYAYEISSRRSPPRAAGLEPIPVALFHDESVQQYEEEFAKFVNRTQRTKGAELMRDPKWERKLRFQFAGARAVEYNHRRHERSIPQPRYDHGRVQGECLDAKRLVNDLPREALYQISYLPLEEFRSLVKENWLPKLHSMTGAEKIERFGSPVAPIYAPLAPEETCEQYEQRFITWLHETKAQTLEQLKANPHFGEERRYRMQFAMANHKGETRFINPRDPRRKRAASVPMDHVEQSKRGKTDLKARYEVPDGAAEPASRVTTYNKIGSETIGRAGESTPLKPEVTSPRRAMVVEHSTEENVDTRVKGEDASAMSGGLTPREVETIEDPIANKLAADYDRLNTVVIDQEEDLEASLAQLKTDDHIDITSILRLQTENEAAMERIKTAATERNACLALLMVYLWRNARDDLQAAMKASGITNIQRVQHMIHRKCDALSRKLNLKANTIADLTKALDAAITNGDYDEVARVASAVGAINSDLIELRRQRRREWATLIRFDERLRAEVQVLLVAAAPAYT